MTKKEIKDFDMKYSLVDAYAQEIVQVMALLYAPENQTDTVNVILGCGIRKDPNKAMKYHEVRDALFSLEGFGVLERDSYSKLCLSHEHQDHIILKYCVKNSNVKKYLSSINAKMEYYASPFLSDVGSQILRKERDLRNALFLGDANSLDKLREVTDDDEFFGLCAIVIIHSFSFELLQNFTEQEKRTILQRLISLHRSSLSSFDSLLLALKNEKTNISQVDSTYEHLYAFCLFLSGNFEALEKVCKSSPDIRFYRYYLATISFSRGDFATAKKFFEEELDIENKLYNTKVCCPPFDFGLYYGATVIASGDALNPQFAKIVNLGIKESPFVRIYYAFKAYIAFEKGDIVNKSKFMKKCFVSGSRDYPLRTLDYTFVVMVQLLIGEQSEESHYMIESELNELFFEGFQNGYDFAAYQAFNLLLKQGKAYSRKSLLKELSKVDGSLASFEKCKSKYIDFSSLIEPEAEWKQALKILKNISSKKAKTVSKDQGARLIWLLSYYDDADCYGVKNINFAPIEQKRQKSGKWSKGRKVALKRIMNQELDSMSSLDSKIGNCLKEEQTYSPWGCYGDINIVFDDADMVPLMAKHPYLFLEESPSTPVELIEEDLQLIVKKGTKGHTVSFSSPVEHVGIQIEKETATRFKFKNVSKTHLDIVKTFNGESTLFIPKIGTNDLKSILSGLSSLMPIHSDIAGVGQQEGGVIKKINGKAVPHIHLLPIADGIRVELFVRPFKDAGPYFKPGYGTTHVLTKVNDKNLEASRNLKKEKAAAEEIITSCPSLGIRGDASDIFNFETPEECLEFLLELKDCKTKMVIEWPEGGKLHVSREYDLKDMKFAVRNKTDWFEVNANLQVNENQLLSMYELLEKAGESKFIELSNGEFIALTDQLKKKLQDLQNFSYNSKEKLKVHSLNVHQIDNLLDDCETFKPGKLWKEQLEKLKDAEAHIPKIPSTLQVDLRSYQEDGFKWLSRLAKWGVGACLADDMGLGKTVQALALILERSKDGPSLVVAPSSVCMNWMSESAKFAPSLNPIFFGSGDRKQILENLKPFDILVTSYGLLLSEEKQLSDIEWNTIVLDEAQFIKNYKAKRTKAAFSLNGNFKVITTGTPVENHLSELWTLFSFINPGLLGSQSDFSAKFAIPIEKYGDKNMRNALKKVIQPFLLRRNKADVLDELPPKTEINISIELSEQERSFYEALRRKSVEAIQNKKDEQKGAVHLQVLAELTKLRQACCHPSLITKNSSIESAKLKMFANIVEELIDNRHKVLIFSQFVGYLKILRDYCDKNGINYQYLDGSTPMKERGRRVDSFQGGEGDVFLISLKAGGTGLNLTAADYVIHMDPWWNPAVEDQASDRTHRIGQQRPVTVYRFVTANSVEEKIIALHKQKRELADSLLDGADITAKMSLDDLINLLAE